MAAVLKATASTMVYVNGVIVTVRVNAGDPVNVSLKVKLYDPEQSAYAINRTYALLWVKSSSKLNLTVFVLKSLKSMTFLL